MAELVDMDYVKLIEAENESLRSKIMSREYAAWIAEQQEEYAQEQLQLNLSGTDEDLELWTVIMEISDFLKHRDVYELLDNLPRHVYDPIAKYVHEDYSKMQLKVMSAKLQAESKHGY